MKGSSLTRIAVSITNQAEEAVMEWQLEDLVAAGILNVGA